jgi:hypothetical protein
MAERAERVEWTDLRKWIYFVLRPFLRFDTTVTGLPAGPYYCDSGREGIHRRNQNPSWTGVIQLGKPSQTANQIGLLGLFGTLMTNINRIRSIQRQDLYCW